MESNIIKAPPIHLELCLLTNYCSRCYIIHYYNHLFACILKVLSAEIFLSLAVHDSIANTERGPVGVLHTLLFLQLLMVINS